MEKIIFGIFIGVSAFGLIFCALPEYMRDATMFWCFMATGIFIGGRGAHVIPPAWKKLSH